MCFRFAGALPGSSGIPDLILLPYQRFSLDPVLTLQISLLAGADFWRTMPIPERGIPSIKTTDGPNGARGEFFTNGTPVSEFKD
jgi:hypothetical protein